MICPGTRRPFLPVNPCRSEPQIPVASTATSTSPGPASGSRRSSTAMVLNSLRTSACIGRLLRERGETGEDGTGSEPWVDVYLRSRSGVRGTETCENVGDLLQAHCRRDERAGVDAAGREEVDRPLQTARGAQHTDCRQILERERPRVDQTRRTRETDEDDPPAWRDEISGERGHSGVVGRVHDGVEVQAAVQRLEGPDRVEPQVGGELARSRAATQEMHLDPMGPRDL